MSALTPSVTADQQSKPLLPAKEGHKAFKQSDNLGERLNAHHATKKFTLFRILYVKLFWKAKSDRSEKTLVEQPIAERLGIPLCFA